MKGLVKKLGAFGIAGVMMGSMALASACGSRSEAAGISRTNNLIAAIPVEVGNDRGYFQARLNEAREEYNALSERDRERVENRARLAEAEAQLVAFDAAVATYKAGRVTTVEGLIAGLSPFLVYEIGVNQDTLRVTFGTDITNATNAFNALGAVTYRGVTTNQQGNVGNVQVKINAIAARDAFDVEVGRTATIDRVIGYIEDVEKFNITQLADLHDDEIRADFGAAVGIARVAFNGLPEAHRLRVTNRALLFAAEGHLSDWQDEYDRLASIASIEKQIDAIFDALPGALTLRAHAATFENAIKAAEALLENFPYYGEVSNAYLIDDNQKLLDAFNDDVKDADDFIKLVGEIDPIATMVLDYADNDGFLVNNISTLNAREAYTSLTTLHRNLVIEVEDIVDLEQLIQDAEAQVAALLGDVENTIPNLVITRDGAAISWNAIPGAVNYTITYNFINYGAETAGEVTQTQSGTTYTIAGDGFITNLRVEANMGTPHDTIVREHVMSNANFATSGRTFSAEVSYLVGANIDALVFLSNNVPVAMENEIMAYVTNTAVANVRNHTAVSVSSSGASTADSGSGLMRVSLRLPVGGSTVINFDESGNVEESYKRIWARAEGSAGLLGSAGMGAARDAATRADRVFFDGTTVHNQIINNRNYVNATGQANWGAVHQTGSDGLTSTLTRNWRTMTPRSTWQGGNVDPSGFFGYVVNAGTISNAANANFGAGHYDSHLNIGTRDRQSLAINANRELSFAMVMNAVQAGINNRHEIARSGGLGPATNVTYHQMLLEFVINADTMDLISRTSNSRYDARHDGTGIQANTRVRTTDTFTFHNEHQLMPWRGDRCACDERANGQPLCADCTGRRNAEVARVIGLINEIDEDMTEAKLLADADLRANFVETVRVAEKAFNGLAAFHVGARVVNAQEFVTLPDQTRLNDALALLVLIGE